VRGARTPATRPSADSTGRMAAGASSARLRAHSMADGAAVLAATGPSKTSPVTMASAAAPARASSPNTSRGHSGRAG
jgi:hypothetical protein